MDGGMNIREVRREVQREVQVSVPMPSGFSQNRSIFQQTYSKSFGIAEGVYPPPSPAFPPSRRRASVAEDLRTDRLNTCNNSNEGNDMARVVKYTECRKNYVATIGGYAVDGCGEFMPSAEDDSPDALICAACGCHRSFHRRVFEHPIGCSCCRTLRG